MCRRIGLSRARALVRICPRLNLACPRSLPQLGEAFHDELEEAAGQAASQAAGRAEAAEREAEQLRAQLEATRELLVRRGREPAGS